MRNWVIRASTLMMGVVAAVVFMNVSSSNSAAGVISGDFQQWHRVSITFDGPQVDEQSTPNPFTDYRLEVTFTHVGSGTTYVVPGFYAADGDAANSSANSGDKWRVHFAPDQVGEWTYSAAFRQGTMIAISDAPGDSAGFFDGETGSFTVTASDKPGTDFRTKGRLQYVGGHHMQFAGTGEYYLKRGMDSPENPLGYHEFDGTFDTPGGLSAQYPFLHEFAPHIGDWQSGDPSWEGGTPGAEKGKGIIGMLNYIASEGVNSMYFLTYNVDGGDGHDTWMWTEPDERFRFDVSKLDQWEIVFSHMTSLGIQLHFVTSENENYTGMGTGGVSDIRALYYRELVARFAHHPAVQWNIGEENGNSNSDKIAFASTIRAFDPYDNPITVHTFYNNVSNFYSGLLGSDVYEATSIQGQGARYNGWAVEMRQSSAEASRPWVIYGDEQGPWPQPDMSNAEQLVRDALWGNLMGGGAGVEWYFGYQGDFGDIQSEDQRIAEPLWRMSRYAVDFFQEYVPFWRMQPRNDLGVSNTQILAQPGEIYVAFFPFSLSNTALDLEGDTGTYTVRWFDPVRGGNLLTGSAQQVSGPGIVSLGQPSAQGPQMWAALVTRTDSIEDTEAPSANDDTATVGIDNTVAITVLANDTDNFALDPATVTITSPPTEGAATAFSGGVISFDATGLQPGDVTLQYTVDDIAGNTSNLATVTVTVTEAPPQPAITRFVLVDTVTNSDLIELSDGMTVNVLDYPGANFSIRAETSEAVGSVVFDFDGITNYRTESVSPYLIAGDENGNYFTWNGGTLGEHTVTATPYSGSGGGGEAFIPLTITFTLAETDATAVPPTETPLPSATPLPTSTDVAAATSTPEPTATVIANLPRVTRFVLVNADDDVDMFALADGMTVNVDDFPGVNFNVRAEVDAPVGSVVFDVDGVSAYKIENTAPYLLAGNTGGNYLVWDGATVGTRTINAVPYSGYAGSGDAYTGLTVSFEFVDDQPPTETPLPTNTPVPPTETPLPTNTPVPPTETPLPTNTPVPPTETPLPTNTPVPPSSTPNPTSIVPVEGNEGPVVVPIADQTNLEGEMVTLQVLANDPDGDTLTYSAFGLPPVVMIDPQTGLISGELSLSGTFNIRVDISDSVNPPISLPFQWTVEPVIGPGGPSVMGYVLVDAESDVDLMPITDGDQIDVSALPTRNLNIRADTTEMVGSVTFDLNGKAAFRIENWLPYYINGNNGGDAYDWFPELGDYTMTTNLHSEKSGKGEIYFSETITFSLIETGILPTPTPLPTSTPAPTAVPNMPPSVQSVPDQVNTVGDSIAMNVFASDPEIDVLTFSASGLPAGLSILSNGYIGGTLTAGGTYAVTVSVSDGNNSPVATAFTWQVSASPTNPQPLPPPSDPNPQPPPPPSDPNPQPQPQPQPTPPYVVRFVLVDSNSDADLFELTDGATISLSQYPNINIRADVSAPVESVVFGLNGNPRHWVEEFFPYAIGHDTEGDYHKWNVSPGTYTITATPYSADGGAGTAYTPLTITINITN